MSRTQPTRLPTMHIWYAVQEDPSDSWDYGSRDFEKAMKMLNEQGYGLIAVIDDDSQTCIDEYYY